MTIGSVTIGSSSHPPLLSLPCVRTLLAQLRMPGIAGSGGTGRKRKGAGRTQFKPWGHAAMLLNLSGIMQNKTKIICELAKPAWKCKARKNPSRPAADLRPARWGALKRASCATPSPRHEYTPNRLICHEGWNVEVPWRLRLRLSTAPFPKSFWWVFVSQSCPSANNRLNIVGVGY